MGRSVRHGWKELFHFLSQELEATGPGPFRHQGELKATTNFNTCPCTGCFNRRAAWDCLDYLERHFAKKRIVKKRNPTS